MKTLSIIFLLAAAMLTSVVQAQQVLSHFTTLAPLTPTAPTAASRVLQLPGFDASLGTLTQVKLTFDGNIHQTAGGLNLNSGLAATYSYSLSTSLSIAKLGDATVFSMGPVNQAGAGNTTAYAGSWDFNGADGFNVSFDTPLSDDHLVQGLLSSYISAGALDFEVLALGFGSAIVSGNGAAAETNVVTGILGVEYSYIQPIPEPSTYAAMAGLAVMLIVTFQRRRGQAT